MRIENFKVGDRVYDVGVPGTGSVIAITDKSVTVLFDADPSAPHLDDRVPTTFTFDDGIDLDCLEHLYG